MRGEADVRGLLERRRRGEEERHRQREAARQMHQVDASPTPQPLPSLLKVHPLPDRYDRVVSNVCGPGFVYTRTPKWALPGKPNSRALQTLQITNQTLHCAYPV